MREKLQTLPLVQLRELAKSQGIKNVTMLRKSQIIDLLCEIDERMKASGENGNAAEPKSAVSEKKEATESRPNSSERKETTESRPNSSERRESAESRPNSSERRETTESRPNSSERRESAESRPNSSERRDTFEPRQAVSSASYEARMAAADYRQTDAMQARSAQAESNGRVNEASLRTQRSSNGYTRNTYKELSPQELSELDSGVEACGILEVMQDGFGFIRCENFLPGENDVYVAPSQIRRFNMKTGDMLRGNRRVKTAAEKFAALLYVTSINGYPTSVVEKRPNFEDLTPIFPNSKLHLEMNGRTAVSMRIVDLLSPIGKGQRGMIVSPPKAGKTTLLKQIARAITINHPKVHVIILLIDERPEEVTDIREAIQGPNVEVIYSTFDELPEHHKRVSEMVIERAKRLVEHGKDVTILLDSITRLARAYNLTVAPSGRTLSGGLDPAALYMPKRFFGAARNMREGGSLTILATALVDTGSRMDDVIFEEFKGTGNMELVLDRKLSEKRLFPAIDIVKSGTRRDDLLLTPEEAEAVEIVRRATNGMKAEESVEKILDIFSKTRNNREFVEIVRKMRTL